MPDLLLPMAALAVPVGAAWIARGAAIAPCRHGRPPAFFAFALRVSWISVGALLAWVTAILPGVVPSLTGLDLAAGVRLPAIGLLVLGPPLCVIAGLGLLVHDVAHRAGLTDWTWTTAVSDAVLQLVGVLVPVVLLLSAMDAVMVSLLREATIAAIAGIAIGFTAVGLRSRAAGLTPHAVMSGPLRDDVFGLAARAGVKLTQLYVVPFRRFRMANAFAVRGNMVILTDLLLRELGREEVNAILAHEMAHLVRRDVGKITWMMAFAIVAAAAAHPFGGWPAVAVVSVAGLLAQLAGRRSIEYATDARALDLGARPEALVTGLARLNHLSQVPLRWSWLAELFLTHPSTERRALRVAARAGLDPATVRAWLEAPPAVGARHPVPGAIEEGRVFDSRFRRRVSGRLIWSLLAVTALVPALTVAALGPFGPVPRLPGIALAALAAFATWQLVWALAAVRSVGALRRPLERRLLRGRDAGDAAFVGLAPGDGPRLFEGFAQWDAGFVSFGAGRLDYVGEETRFSLRPDEVRDVRLDLGLPAWIPLRAVRVRWERADGSSGAFGLMPIGLASAFHARGASQRLFDRVCAWHAGGGMPGRPAGDVTPAVAAGSGTAFGTDADAGGAPPSADGVTSASPRDALAPRSVIVTVVVLWLLSLAATFLVGLPPHPFARGGFDAWLATMIAYGLAVVPIATWRERARAAPPREDLRRAA